MCVVILMVHLINKGEVMAQVLINDESKKIEISFENNEMDMLIFEKTKDMLDNISDDFQAQVITMALQSYTRTSQCYELFAKRMDLEY